MSGPEIKTKPMPDDENAHLDGHAATEFRRDIPRCNFIAQDRPDVEYAVGEMPKGMQIPRETRL